MSYVLFQINNDKDMSDNVMSRCLLTFSMFCEGILLVYGVVSNPELAHCHQYLIQLFEGG